MAIQLTITQPACLHHIGGRGNNEDYVFPTEGKAKPSDRFFAVFDGVGGAEKGEVASELAANSFRDYYKANPSAIIGKAYMETALDHIQAQFDAYLDAHAEAKGMATTMVCLTLHEAGATVAHVGDSRAYHLRDGKILWKTDDHSLVNDLVKLGAMTPEAAAKSHQKNVISRAIQGSKVQKIKPDVHQIFDLKPNDAFLLCSDGFTDKMTDADIAEKLGTATPGQDILNAMLAKILERPNDNVSAYLVRISAVFGEVSQELIDRNASTEIAPTEAATQMLDDSPRAKKVVVEEPYYAPYTPPRGSWFSRLIKWLFG